MPMRREILVGKVYFAALLALAPAVFGVGLASQAQVRQRIPIDP